MHRLALAQLPMVTTVKRTAVAPDTIATGTAVGSNGKGCVVRLDVLAGTLTRNQDPPIALAAGQDPLTPGLVAVDDDGAKALFMAARAPHADPTLVLVDLVTHATVNVRSFDGPGWLCGGFAGTRVVVCEQRLGDRAAFSVLVAGDTVLHIEGMQQPCVPVHLYGDVVALLLCLAPSALTGTGDSALVALDLGSGAVSSLAPAAGNRVRLDDGALVVDGGAECVRVTLARSR